MRKLVEDNENWPEPLRAAVPAHLLELDASRGPHSRRRGRRGALVRRHLLQRNSTGGRQLLQSSDPPMGIPHVYEVPYSTSVHYVPQAVRPPALGAWRPDRMLDHARPVLASYLTTVRNGQKPDSEYLLVKRQVAVLCQDDADCVVHFLDAPPAHLEEHPALQHVELPGVPAGPHSFARFAFRHFEALAFLSTFCLTPPGDTVSRKGLFDAILMGCIPVVFYEGTAKYPWHLPSGRAGLKQCAPSFPRSLLPPPVTFPVSPVPFLLSSSSGRLPSFPRYPGRPDSLQQHTAAHTRSHPVLERG